MLIFLKRKNNPKVWSDEWILQQAEKHNLRVGFVKIGTCDDLTVIDDYIHLVKNKDGIEK